MNPIISQLEALKSKSGYPSAHNRAIDKAIEVVMVAAMNIGIERALSNMGYEKSTPSGDNDHCPPMPIEVIMRNSNMEEHCSKHMVKAELHCPICTKESTITAIKQILTEGEVI